MDHGDRWSKKKVADGRTWPFGKAICPILWANISFVVIFVRPEA